MSSRRKSTTPCMVLPAHVVEQNEPEEKTERKKEEEVEEEKGKEGAEEGPTAGELDQAVVVVPTPPDTGETPHSALYRRLWTFKTSLTRSVCLIVITDEPNVSAVLSAFQAQHTAAAAAQSQLLIPLSSIPSYSAAMDTNPLLGSTYKKFPYPSMAEINSLAAQTQFTEEQIKVWFSAQRLKHGVSWTPEEVEEARRKQFNGTVHTVPQTITVIPAHQLSAAANGLQSILQTCQIVGQPGLVFTQVGPGGNLPVTSPITLTVAGMPSQSQSSNRVSCQPTLTNSDLKRATTVQPPSLSPQCLCVCLCNTLFADTFSLRPKKSKEQLAELKASYLKNHFVTDAEIARLMNLTNLTKGEIKKWFSDTRYNQRNSKNSHVITPTSPLPPHFTLQKFKEKTPEQLVVLEESFEKGSTPSDEELSRLRTETKLTRREIDAWFTERRKMPSVTQAAGGGTGTSSSSLSASLSRRGSQTPPGGRSKQLPSTSNKDLKDKNKKTPEQLHILKSAFVRTQWPTPEEYDQLAEESGLPRSYIVSWFGDSRYSWKNSNLKWFFQYQSGNVEAPNGGGGNKMGDMTLVSSMSLSKVREWFAEVQRRVETGSDPFQDSAAGRMDGDGGGDELGVEMQVGASKASEEQAAAGMGADEDDEGDEEDGDDTDDSEVWEPSRSVRKSLSVSED
uniref:Zinc fingers and homeoboxes protein 1 n=1 Tax=Mola mola TaxID=94237 RepID=A0A3Q3W8W7_MOLML